MTRAPRSPAEDAGSRAARRPDVELEAVAELAASAWGLEGELRELPSDSDRNFLIDAACGRLVLKVYARGTDPELVAAEADAHDLARAAGLPCPAWLRTKGGESVATLLDRRGKTLLARAVTWLDGRHLADAPRSPALAAELGRILGRLDRALETLERPALSRTLEWDLAHASRVIRERATHVADAQRRQLLLELVADTDRRTGGRIEGLRKSVIHNDANDYNVLVGPAAPQRTPFERFEPSRVTGLLDFGDLVETYTVCEPAIAAAYLMLTRRDPIAAIAPMVAAYHAEKPLDGDEIDLLFPLARLRLALSVTMAASQRAAEPENAYLSVSEAPAWRALERTVSIHPRLAATRLRLACGMEPVPGAARALGALHRANPAPVLGTPLDALGTAVVDLSVGTPLLCELADRSDQAEWQTAIERELERREAQVGWGRWDEPRGWYTSDVFAGEAELEPRTIHLGVDLFAAPGTPVCSPLPAVVHSLGLNDRPLDYGGTVVLEHTLDDGEGSVGAEPVRVYTLYGHLSHASVRGLERGQRVECGAPFAALGEMHENGGWAPHLHFQIVLDLLDHEGDFPGVARPAERAAWLALSPDPNVLLRWDDAPGTAAAPGRSTQAEETSPERLLARRRRVLSPSLSLSYREPLWIVRGEGAALFDHLGRRYLDLVNNVCHVGHAHPRVVAAIHRQATILNTNTRYLHPRVVELAEGLLATLPEPLEVCTFVNSGSEANDLALRIARTATGRRDVVCLDGAYHGNLTALIDVSPYKHDGPGGAGAPRGVHRLPLPDAYRGRHRDAASSVYADEARRLIEGFDDAGGGLAALIAEPILGCGGQIDPPPGYLATLFDAVRDRGGVAIADEVQTGFGRVGSHFWAHQAHGAVPDIVTLGKPMGNGHPIGAVITTRALAERFANGMEYFNTYGGNPVSCAAALAVLETIEEEGLQANARERGGQLLTALRALAERYPAVGDVRGRGLFLGIELTRDPASRAPDSELAAYLVERLVRRGLLLSTDGPDHNVLKIKPPLVISRHECARFVAELEQLLAETLD